MVVVIRWLNVCNGEMESGSVRFSTVDLLLHLWLGDRNDQERDAFEFH